jgi:hypothetical protein
VAGLHDAAEAKTIDRKDIGDLFRDIAAGITWLEQRHSGKVAATEVIMLAVE